MTIILFLVDTSASMNQRTYLGTSLIDIAKASFGRDVYEGKNTRIQKTRSSTKVGNFDL